MKRLLKIFLPITVIGSGVLVGWLILRARPEAETRRPPPTTTQVEVIPARRSDFQIRIHSQGTVQARTETTLTSQVAGQIMEVAPAFRAGGFFEPGDVLVTLNPDDYETAVIVAEAALAQASLRLAEEEAQSTQALRDWEKVGRGEPPSALALREPQLAEAAAATRAAEARLLQTRRDLEDTRVRAPFAGRVFEHRADVGQYITSNTVLARIYSVDFAEVRLPLSERQLDHVSLPEDYRGVQDEPTPHPEVTLSGGLGRRLYSWTGRIVRTEGAVDTQSRQLFVVAEVEDPYGQSVTDRPPLKVGMFVRAEIAGNLMKDVFVLPRSVLRENRLLLVANAENQLERREVDVLWRDEDHLVIREGIEPGEQVIKTQLAYAVEGMAVKPVNRGSSGPGGDLAGVPDASREAQP